MFIEGTEFFFVAERMDEGVGGREPGEEAGSTGGVAARIDTDFERGMRYWK